MGLTWIPVNFDCACFSSTFGVSWDIIMTTYSEAHLLIWRTDRSLNASMIDVIIIISTVTVTVFDAEQFRRAIVNAIVNQWSISMM